MATKKGWRAGWGWGPPPVGRAARRRPPRPSRAVDTVGRRRHPWKAAGTAGGRRRCLGVPRLGKGLAPPPLFFFFRGHPGVGRRRWRPRAMVVGSLHWWICRALWNADSVACGRGPLGSRKGWWTRCSPAGSHRVDTGSDTGRHRPPRGPAPVRS